MPLTALAAKHAKPKAKPYKLTDEDGLHLLVHPNGGKYWRFSYRFNGKQKTLALGIYPDVSLVEAREGRSQARAMLKNGTDPSEERRASKEALADERNAARKEPAALRFEFTEAGNLLIQSKAARLLLNPAQVDALRSFLMAIPTEPSEAPPAC